MALIMDQFIPNQHSILRPTVESFTQVPCSLIIIIAKNSDSHLSNEDPISGLGEPLLCALSVSKESDIE